MRSFSDIVVVKKCREGQDNVESIKGWVSRLLYGPLESNSTVGAHLAEGVHLD